MLFGNALSNALEEIVLGQFHGTAYRLIGHHYIETALSAVGSVRYGGRYNIAATFEALYLAEDPVTALHETKVVLQTDDRLIGIKGSPRLLLSIECRLDHVLNLADEAIQECLETTRSELVSSWLPFVGFTPAAPTQELGAAAYATGRISALRAPSARVAGAINIIVFPDRLREGEYVEVFDEMGMVRARIDGV